MSKVLVVAPQVGQARDPQVSSIIASPSPFPIPVRLPLPVWRIGVMNVSVTATPCQERPQMKTFTIDNENNISVFATQEEAAAATATPFDSFASQQELADLVAATATPFDSFASQQELADLAAHWPAERLLAVWNSLPGVTAVKKFKDRNTAISRIWARIQGLGEPVAPKAAAPVGTPEPKADQPAKPKAERKAKGGAQAATRGAQVGKGAPAKGKAAKKTTAPNNAPKGKKVVKAKDAAAPREGSKTAQVVAMLQRKGGATLAEVMKKMGWQKHTVRGFMAGAMKKAGYQVESFKPEGGERTYRINK